MCGDQIKPQWEKCHVKWRKREKSIGGILPCGKVEMPNYA